MINPENKRTFIGVKVYPDSFFTESIVRMRAEYPGDEIRWVNNKNYHITLLFLGETDPQIIPAISLELSQLANDFSAFNFLIKGVGVFRSLSYPKVLYAGISDNGILTEIRNEIIRRLDGKVGIHDGNTFSPHLTLARMKKCNDKPSLQRLVNKYREHEFMKVKTTELIFFESVSTKEGVAYFPVSKHPFPV